MEASRSRLTYLSFSCSSLQYLITWSQNTILNSAQAAFWTRTNGLNRLLKSRWQVTLCMTLAYLCVLCMFTSGPFQASLAQAIIPPCSIQPWCQILHIFPSVIPPISVTKSMIYAWNISHMCGLLWVFTTLTIAQNSNSHSPFLIFLYTVLGCSKFHSSVSVILFDMGIQKEMRLKPWRDRVFLIRETGTKLRLTKLTIW